MEEPEAALREVARRFLSAYGPATPEEFARWWGTEPAPAKRLFKALGDELVAVEVEGWRGWALASTLPELSSTPPAQHVALLPAFDPYTVALCRHLAVLAPEHLARVSRPQGWISPVVLVDGRIVGTWEQEARREATAITCSLFAPVADAVREQVAGEAERLGAFLGMPSSLTFA